MTIDKTLKVRKGLGRVRSVLTRAERLEKLKEAERWKAGSSPLGLPKVRVSKLALKKKKKEKKEEGEAGAAEAGKKPDAKGGGKSAPKAAAAKPAAKPAAKK